MISIPLDVPILGIRVRKLFLNLFCIFHTISIPYGESISKEYETLNLAVSVANLKREKGGNVISFRLIWCV